MPFTLTHVAAVIPLRRNGLMPFSALVIGSMIPDLPLFFSFGVHYSQMHSAYGVISYCLFIGALVYTVFQAIGRAPLMAILPTRVIAGFGARPKHTASYIMGVLLAIMIGAATHVLWDSFTHRAQWGVALLPKLNHQFELLGFPLTGYSLMQHLSSIVFLPLMLGIAYFEFRRLPLSDKKISGDPFSTRKKTMLFSLLFVLPLIWACVEAWLDTRSVYYGIGQAARAYGTYLLTLIFIYSFFMSVWMRLKTRL